MMNFFTMGQKMTWFKKDGGGSMYKSAFIGLLGMLSMLTLPQAAQ